MDKRKEGNSLENKLSKLLQLTKNKESTSHKVKEVQRSYSPTSILTHQTTKMKPIVNHHEKKPIKETNNVIKHYNAFYLLKRTDTYFYNLFFKYKSIKE